ncbi:Hypothetical predicted protein [Marmota monax]|uniref:VWF/SSPO/Zonadhesin-like cysteine-rich domain-containing protein n=1 Tax=Marmota monax TaxID=9995 RepID=A0A5E4CKR1_MARMO|nr:Hypothetical predicted protein [Marmota monax]
MSHFGALGRPGPDAGSWPHEGSEGPGHTTSSPQVDPTVFYEACVQDSCSCDTGGDCECFCSAVASYAQECTKAEACVFWRTPDLCPIFCDYYNPPDECEWHYEPCGNRSFETCRTINGIHSNISVSYLEGEQGGPWGQEVALLVGVVGLKAAIGWRPMGTLAGGLRSADLRPRGRPGSPVAECVLRARNTPRDTTDGWGCWGGSSGPPWKSKALALCPSGCYPRCPTDRPIYDEDLKKCVTGDQCGCYVGDTRYPPGALVPTKDICTSWYSSPQSKGSGGGSVHTQARHTHTHNKHTHTIPCCSMQVHIPMRVHTATCISYTHVHTQSACLYSCMDTVPQNLMGGAPLELVLGMGSALGAGLEGGAGGLQPLCLLCSVCTDSSHVVCHPEEGKLSSVATSAAGSLQPAPSLHPWAWPAWGCPLGFYLFGAQTCSDLLCCAAAHGLL